MTQTKAASGAPAVTRAASILDLLAAEESVMTLADIARGIDAAKSSTLSVCTALEAARLIERTESGYRLGRRLVELGGAYLQQADVVSEFYHGCASSPVLSRELLQMAVLDGTHVLYLARHEGHAPLRLSASIGDRFPASITAIGNALLSKLDDAVIRDRYRDPSDFPQWTSQSVSTVEGLLAKVRATRERGYALDEGETNPAVYGIAVPVRPRTSSDNWFGIGASLFQHEDPAYLESVTQELLKLAASLDNPLLLNTPNDEKNA